MPAKTTKEERHQLIDEQGRRIRIARKLGGYKKAIDLRNALFPDMTESLYYQFELGRRKANDKVMQKIAEKCKVAFKWLKTGDGDPFAGIKIQPDEKSAKKAIIAYNSLTEKFASDKDTKIIPDELAKKMTHFSAVKPAKRDVVFVINTDVMKKVFKGLVDIYQSSSKSINYDRLSEFAAQAYSDIVANEDDPDLQIKMIKVVLAPYKRLIGKK